MKRPSLGDVSNDVGCVKDTFSVQAAGSGTHQLESAEAAVSQALAQTIAECHSGCLEGAAASLDRSRLGPSWAQQALLRFPPKSAV